MPLTDSLISFWKLDEASGSRADAHGSNTLTDNNTVLSGTGKITALAADFEESASEYLSRADNASLQTGDIDFTLAGWVNLESAGFRTIVAKEGDSASREYVLWYDTTGAVATNRFFFRVVGTAGVSGDVMANNFGSLSLATWAFVVVWHDSVNNQVGIQVNNGVADTTAHTAGVVAQAQPFTMGQEGTTLTRYWDGLLNGWGFWKRILTANEKTQLWAGGNGLNYPLVPPLPKFKAQLNQAVHRSNYY